MTTTAPSGAPWSVLSAASAPSLPDKPLRSRRVYAQVLALTVLVLVVVGAASLGSRAAGLVAALSGSTGPSTPGYQQF